MAAGVVKRQTMSTVIVDTTVQPKAITHLRVLLLALLATSVIGLMRASSDGGSRRLAL